MSLGLHSQASLAVFGSEAAALKVPMKQVGLDPAKWEFLTHRLDLDETHGEVVRLSLRERPAVAARQGEAGSAHETTLQWRSLHISSYRLRLKRDLSAEEIRGRMVRLLDNPLVQPLPLLSGAAVNDPVGADIEAIPTVLARVRKEWLHADSFNRLSATSLSRMLLEKMALQRAHERRDVDLLLVGVETSLWLAEQFVADVSRALPRVSAMAVSANKVTALLGCDLDIANTGAPGSRSTFVQAWRNAIVLVVSQSGQTFPGLHATRLLRHLCGNRVFVMTGEYDTKMGLVVGQCMSQPDPEHFCCRIFSNLSGWRPAEPTTVAAAAAHASLTELLLFLLHAYTVELNCETSASLLGLTLSREDVRSLAELRDGSVLDAIPEICLRADGESVVGLTPRQAVRRKMLDMTAGKLPGVHEKLVRLGKNWAVRVTEPWHATVVAAVYVFGTIFFQFAPMNVVSVVIGCGQPFYYVCPLDWRCCVIGFALRLMDVIIYIWIGWFFLLFRRYLQGTDVLARRGKRTLVIADCPYVHQSLEVYVSKLFALAYGDNGLDVHGASPGDHLVHRFTHRVQRGVLIALGRPDGRLLSLQRAEGACLLSAMQAAAIQSFGTGPEIVSLGHNTLRGSPGAIAEHAVLPTHRRPFMCEFLAKARTSRPRHSLEATLAELASGVLSKTVTESLPTCSRCNEKAARVLCVMCRINLCRGCHEIVHKRSHDGEMRQHEGFPMLAAMMMIASLQRARRRLAAKNGFSILNDDAEIPDPAYASLADKLKKGVTSLGSGAGLAFTSFGEVAAELMCAPHGPLLRGSGAPLSMHHARVFLAGLSSRRARARWASAIRVTLLRGNHWKSLFLHVKRASAKRDGQPLSDFEIVYRECIGDSASPKPMLAAELAVSDLYEGRFGSFERYVAFMVLFHAMALRVASSSFPLPAWDISRSQSILRVASTAAPVSGAGVARQLAGDEAPTAFSIDEDFMGTTFIAGGTIPAFDAVGLANSIRDIVEERLERDALKKSALAHGDSLEASDESGRYVIPPPKLLRMATAPRLRYIRGDESASAHGFGDYGDKSRRGDRGSHEFQRSLSAATDKSSKTEQMME